MAAPTINTYISDMLALEKHNLPAIAVTGIGRRARKVSCSKGMCRVSRTDGSVSY